MKLLNQNGIKYLSYINSPLCVAGSSTRINGFSKGKFKGMNLGLNSADDKNIVTKNRNSFYNTLFPEFTVKYMQQMHSDIIHKVSADFINNTEGDAFYTTERGILLSISAADCGSIVLHDEDFTIVAAIHCGWRGAQADIVEKTVSELSAFVHPENLVAYIGPMIQQESYEVGPEFCDYFDNRYLKKKNDKWFFNLNVCIEDSLVHSGVGRIANSRIDTVSNPDLYYSYRRDGETGRFNAFIGISK